MTRRTNFFEVIEENNKPNSVWEKYVPIIADKDETTFDVFLHDSISVPSEYNELIYILRYATKGTVINININNGGGHIDSAFAIRDAILKSNARVIGHLSGTVASAATVISLSCDEIVVSPYLSFMVHNYSAGIQGKGHELKAYQTFLDKELDRAFRDIYAGFFTAEEMESIIEGKDFWINDREVMERWENFKQVRG